MMQEKGKPEIVSKRSIYTQPSNPRPRAHISRNRIRFTLAVGPQEQVLPSCLLYIDARNMHERRVQRPKRLEKERPGQAFDVLNDTRWLTMPFSEFLRLGTVGASLNMRSAKGIIGQRTALAVEARKGVFALLKLRLRGFSDLFLAFCSTRAV